MKCENNGFIYNKLSRYTHSINCIQTSIQKFRHFIGCTNNRSLKVTFFRVVMVFILNISNNRVECLKPSARIYIINVLHTFQRIHTHRYARTPFTIYYLALRMTSINPSITASIVTMYRSQLGPK